MRTNLFACCALVVACGGGAGGVQTSKQENSEPQGLIAGRVLDAATGMPVVGVQVATYASSMAVTAATDPTGRYQLGPVPAGSYTLSAEAAGFVKRVFTGVVVAGAAGNFPTGNVVVTRDFDMAKADATIDGTVTTNTTLPAASATVFIDLRGSNFEVVTSVKTDTAGRFKLSGLPGAASGLSATVAVAPYDENGDGAPDYTSASRTYSLFPGFTATGPITITAVGVPLLSSNIADADLAPTEAIVLTFGAPLRANQSTFSLQRTSLGLLVGLNVSWDAARTTVTLTPAGGPLVEGQNHQLSWALRADSTATANGSQTFVVRAASSTPLGNVSNFRVTTPANGLYDAQLSSVAVAWDAVSGAGGYRLYARDAQANPAYLQLTSFGATAISGSSALQTNIFGSGSGVLSGGNKVTLALVAVDRGGNEGPLSMAPTLELADNTAPTVTQGVQLSGSANNLAGSTPATVSYRVSWSEPMLPSSTPLLQPNTAQLTSTFTWQSQTQGVFTITVPPGVSGAGPLQVSGGRDTSNNLQDGGYSGSLN